MFPCTHYPFLCVSSESQVLHRFSFSHCPSVCDFTEESPAAKELRGLIRQHLSEELSRLKLDVEKQIKESEEAIQTKLLAAEGGSKTRTSAKGKKK